MHHRIYVSRKLCTAVTDSFTLKLSLVLSVLMSLVCMPASAVQTPEHLHGQEGLLFADDSRSRLTRETSWDVPEAANKSWLDFKNSSAIAPSFAQNSSAWRALWDHGTAVPTRIFGKGIFAPGSMQSEAIAQRAAEAFLAEHIDLLAPGASFRDFKAVSNHLGQDIRTIGFIQYKDGLEVLGGQVSFRFKNDRLFVIGSEALPHVKVDAVEQTISESEAKGIAQAWIIKETGSTLSGAVVEGPFVLPLLKYNQAPQYATVMRVTLDAKKPVGKWEVFIDVKTGAEVAREQKLMFVTSKI